MKLKPVLVNPEFNDPILFISIPQKSEVILFDLGYCFRLKIRDIRKISKIFISHTHIDHFAGFDHILRLSVDMDKTISIYGPPHFIKNVSGKLAGYLWNLKEGISLNYEVFEIHKDRILKKLLEGKKGFVNDSPPEVISFQETDPIAVTPDYSVYPLFLEHLMPILGFKIIAADSSNADISIIKKEGLSPGKWVGELKERIVEGISPDEEIVIEDRKYNLSELAKKIIRKKPGTKIAYIVDTIFNKATAKPLKKFVKDVDYFFCECAYLTEERDLARQNYHLTAKQAATIALEGGAGNLIPFHFSRRYESNPQSLYDEAKSVFDNVVIAPKYDDQHQ